MWTRDFWRDVIERALKTGAQVAVATLFVTEGLSLADIDWGNGLGVVGASMLLSVLTSVASGYTGEKGTAQLGAGSDAYTY